MFAFRIVLTALAAAVLAVPTSVAAEAKPVDFTLTDLSGKPWKLRDQNLPRHPALMPEPLVEFFVRFLTEPNDVVFDPFSGSNTTGSVAERLGREWVGVEADAAYAEASKIRFAA